MMFKLKNIVLGTAIAGAAALPLSAHAVNGASFDPDGGGSGTAITQMTWNAGNAIFDNLFAPSLVANGDPNDPGGASGTLLAQTELGGLTKASGGVLGFSPLITYQLGLSLTSSLSGTTTSFNQFGGNGAVNFFRIYADTTPSFDLGKNDPPYGGDATPEDTSQNTGLGWGDSQADGTRLAADLVPGQVLILEGLLTLRNDAFTLTDTTGSTPKQELATLLSRITLFSSRNLSRLGWRLPWITSVRKRRFSSTCRVR